MTIQLKPETEALIKKRRQSGEDWLAENRNEIGARIQEGWDEAQRGELIDGEQVRADLQQFKADWMKQRCTA